MMSQLLWKAKLHCVVLPAASVLKSSILAKLNLYAQNVPRKIKQVRWGGALKHGFSSSGTPCVPGEIVGRKQRERCGLQACLALLVCSCLNIALT